MEEKLVLGNFSEDPWFYVGILTTRKRPGKPNEKNGVVPILQEVRFLNGQRQYLQDYDIMVFENEVNKGDMIKYRAAEDMPYTHQGRILEIFEEKRMFKIFSVSSGKELDVNFADVCFSLV